MRIAYLSRLLTIHDYRFLQKLVTGGYETWLITSYQEELPENIRTLPNLQVERLQTLHRYDPRRLVWSVLPWQLWFGLLRLVQEPAKGLLGAPAGGALHAQHPLVRIGFWTLARQYERLIQLLQRIQPHVLHAGWVQGDGLLAAATGFHPFLLMPWGSDILVLPKRSKGDCTLARYVIQHADLITCDCQVVKEEILALAPYDPEKIVVFPWGIDLRLFQRNQEAGQAIRTQLGWQDKKILIMTRSFLPVYAVDDFLQALPIVLAAEPETRVLLIGRGEREAALKQLAERLGLGTFIHWTGFVPNTQLPHYLSAADLYVSSSLSDGTATSHLEAMACGLPMVLTDTPSTFEWVNDGVNGRVVPRANPPALAQAIVELLQQPDLRHIMGERNLTIAQARADWDKNFAKLETMYQTLCGILWADN
jgi:glycosyltransferase involved in cell wall biosynthesis